MGLRDIFLLVTIYGSIPFIYMKPFIGVLVWYWLALMNPHRISWTLTNQPFAQIIALAMLSSLLIARNEPKQLPVTPITVTLGLFWVWMLVTTVFSLYPNLAWWQWDKVWKIMLTTFVAILVLNSKERIIALTTVAALSIGYYGFKGGLFTILKGGNFRVWGPPGSFIGGNNEVGLALIMTIPLLFFLRSIVPYRLVKLGLLIGIVLCVFAIFGTQSRGAFVGVTAMGLYLVWKSKNKFGFFILAAVLGTVVFTFMPPDWHERMGTIATYEEDGSAMGRIKAWEMAFNLALNRPFGGGFETFKPATYLMYLPEVGGRRTDAHSIYFETMAEHGFIGLTLFLLIGIFSLLACGRIIRRTRRIADLQWMNMLARMMQVALIGYAVSGAFLGLAYFNFYYALVAIVVGMTVVLKQELPVTAPEKKQGGAMTPPHLQPALSSGLAAVMQSSPSARTAGRAPKPVAAPARMKALPTIKEAIALGKDWYHRL
ncbi:putative O-glycosylation ligase, exosortase A system-associated [Thiohalocapsa halophila]|uniref:O-glycosylation ligase, exosortase A system-associated n=1 Tax=Thiohalocapsa halophila TaxID=69359 RepID=A0ABS1CGR2_9GAMM|nr:putative O-glycosylation ligase, exosortase A system-associated [Thiohalocapsa halophila]MBK1631083.1 putative O-glycosylation ligase, exosortase A system-associated [Thiohalocapsa halophila]